MRREDELEAFKVRINLTEYAAAMGFLRDRRRSSPNCCVMKRSSGEGIVVGKASDGHWIYYAIGDESDSGSIVDFVQNRGGGNLGQVRRELRPWLDGTRCAPVTSSPDTFVLSLQPSTKDLLGVQVQLAAMAPALGGHAYLEGRRSIPRAVLLSDRFSGRIFSDARGNAVFPHRNRGGPCGYELKNEGFTGFSPGGEKGLWFSGFLESDVRMVVAETAIDALSYAALKGTEGARFFSVGGSMSPAQPELLLSAVAKAPSLEEVVLAMDNDAGGKRLSERIRQLVEERPDLRVRVTADLPAEEGQDWNDVLRSLPSPER